MSLSVMILDAPSHDPQAILYFAQSATYGLALWSSCSKRHAPWVIYLASCLIHLALGLLHGLPG